MLEPSIPHNETARLAVLQQCSILDTSSEESFDDAVRVAATLADTPIALVSLVDASRQWFKARHGLSATETPRRVSFCGHALLQESHLPFIIEDATKDQRFSDNPLVTGGPHVIFYAGFPLVVKGHALGTLCVIDHKPRTLTADRIIALEALKRQVEKNLEWRLVCQEQENDATIARQSSFQLDSIFKSLDTGLVIHNRLGRVIKFNAAAERILGLSAETLNGQSSENFILECIHEDGRPFAVSEHPDVITRTTGKRCTNVVMGIRKRDTSLTWISINSVAIPSIADTDPAVVASFIDITKHKKQVVEREQYITQLVAVQNDLQSAKARIAIKEEKLRLAVEASGTGLWDWNIVTGELDLNSVWLSMLGYKPGELPGVVETWTSIVHPEDLPKAMAAVQENMEGKSSMFRIEYRCRHKDGRWIWILDSGEVVTRGTAGEPLRMIGTHVDIHSMKEVQEQLNEARLIAERATKAKADFLANMSHEIRTPMNGVMGMTSLLLETSLTNEQREYTETINNSADLLMTIINDILDFSKIESGHLQLENLQFSPALNISECVQLIGRQASIKGIAIVQQTSANMDKHIVADAGRFRQVVLNLLSNAIKFTSTGSVTVSMDITDSPSDPLGSLLRVVVTDTGMGISAEKLSTLFQPFIQGDASITRQYGGTGLGLVISRRLCRLMGGDLTVKSTPGLGSSFTVLITCAKCPTEKIVVSDKRKSSDAIPAILRGRVLIAEDNSVNARIAQAFCKKAHIQTDVVGNGQEALDAHRAHPYDVILMDAQMPVMDGLTATRLLRQEEKLGTHVPIISLTANAFAEDRELCLAAGMDDFLSKPFRSHELIAMLSQWLPQSGQKNTAPPAVTP